MLEKKLNIVFLLDFYGDILSERKRNVMDLYYNEDFSLSEISDQIGISRQGVRDIIKKSEEELLFFEEKLGFAAKLLKIGEKTEELLADARKRGIPDDFSEELENLKKLIVKV